MKRYILSLLLFSSTIIHNPLYSNRCEYIPSNRVFNVIQNAFSMRLGSRFNKMSEQERKILYAQAQNNLYGAQLASDQSFYKKTICKAVDEVLITLAGRYAHDFALNYQSQLRSSPAHIRQCYETIMRNECNTKPDEKIFEIYLQENFIKNFVLGNSYNNHPITQVQTSSFQSPSFFDKLYAALEWIFSATPSTEAPRNPIPASSTNTYSSKTLTPAQVFPQDACIICFESFSSNCLSYFLPCGHNYCKDCLQEWLFDQNKNECPQCRHKLTLKEKVFLREAFFTNYICTLCNDNHNLLSSLSGCSHYLCHFCAKRWLQSNNNYSTCCPRCFSKL